MSETVQQTQHVDDVNTQTAFAVIAGCAALVVALIVVVFYWLRDRAMNREITEVQRRFDALKVRMSAMYRHTYVSLTHTCACIFVSVM